MARVGDGIAWGGGVNSGERILFVDDEPRLLAGIRRQLHNRYSIETAPSPSIALDLLSRRGPFAVVVSDMQMPGPMNGAAFLAEVKAQCPVSIRVMLTGQTDVTSAIAAVNEGHIFRFLTKPCATETLLLCIEAALDQYRLRETERELLERTLDGAAQLLLDAMGTVNPEAFSRTAIIRRYAEGVAAILALPDRWRIRLAATVAHIGYVAVPAEILTKYLAGETLSDSEARMFDAHPDVARRLLTRIPRLEEVSEMVARQADSVPAEPLAAEPHGWDATIAGAMILQASIEFERLLRFGSSETDACSVLRAKRRIPQAIVEALVAVHRKSVTIEPQYVDVIQLAPGMLLDQDVVTNDGRFLVARGTEVTATMRARLSNFGAGVGIEEPIKVLVRVNLDGGAAEPAGEPSGTET